MIAGWSIAVSLVLAGAASLGENQNEIKVTTRRPLLAVVEQLRQRHGWRITYEDDAMSASDVYTLEFGYATPKTDQDPLPVLTRLVSVHASLGHGRFRVEKSDFGWHVAPFFGSVLDARVSIRDQVTSLKDVAENVCAVVSRDSGKKVVAGRVSPDRSRAIRLHGEKEQARAILARALAQLRAPFVWDLLYSDELEGYILVVNQLFRVSGAGSGAGQSTTNPSTNEEAGHRRAEGAFNGR